MTTTGTASGPPADPAAQARALHEAGLRRFEAGDLAAAADFFRQAVALNPDVAAYHSNLAAVLRGRGSPEERVELYRRAIALKPDDAVTRANLAAALTEAGDCTAAEAEARAALERAPSSASAWLNLAGALAGQARWEAAAGACERVLGIDADNLAALECLAKARQAAGRSHGAIESYRRLVASAPELPRLRVDLGMLLQTLGRHGDAVAEFRAALALDPRSLPIVGNLGTSLTYSADHGPADLKQVYDEFDRVVAQPLLDPRPHANDRDPERRLRVGYVSPDFRKHAVAYFALPLLEGHRRELFEVACYYNHRQDDEWTARFRAAADRWTDCAGMSHAALAERIREDGIDVLVDLAGHTEHNRLLAFARKPAPVQLTWLGYVTTTGLSAIDYRLTHADADPPGVDADYAETLLRLPGAMWCYRPLPGMPEVAPPPFARKGHVTFGSFNRYSKISRRVLECWARILAAVPGSRLVMCMPAGDVRREVAALFAQYGIGPERLFVYARLAHELFWALHGEVDIALDPFPFNGGTTSCETLWLGVPLVTCSGGPGSFASRFASRMGRALLNAVGIAELAATTEEDYVGIAVALAGDPGRLAAMRAALRPRMAASPLTDERRFVAEVESAYRAAWRRWCGRQGGQTGLETADS